MADARTWRTIGLWIVAAVMGVLVIAWLAGTFKDREPPEAIEPEAIPEQPRPETIEPDGLMPTPEPEQQQ